MASKWVEQFLGSASKSFTQDEIRRSKYGEYFEHLQQNLDKYEEENILLKNANEILSLEIGSSKIELLIDDLLRLIPDFNFEYRRIILVTEKDPKGTLIDASNSSLGLEYLDSQIIKLLEKNERIFIHDTSKIHTLKFQPEKVVPKSVLGLSLDTETGWKGYLWFANLNEVNFTKDQVDSLEKIKTSAARSLSRILRSISLMKELQLWNTALNQIPYPFLIFRNNQIIGKNQKAEKIINWGENQEIIDLGENVLSAVKQENTQVEVCGRSFRLEYSVQNVAQEEVTIFVFLVDESDISTQRNYLNNVMQGISLNIEKPLNNIMGFSGMIPLLADVEKSQQDYLNKISQQAKNCLAFSQDLLELSRFSGDQPFITRNASIGDLTSNLLEASHHLLRQKRVSIKNEVEDPDQIINVDTVLFGQAFYLVLEFMLDQLESGKTISIISNSENGEFKYQFSDNGKGFSDIDVSLLNMQEPDGSIDQRIRVAGEIIRLYGGRLDIQSELGKGSAYIFYWPACQRSTK
ncbi:MAG: HAMP domain-containing histidine kinase [Chloroflexi bacterium]|nr:HAMP domain-containing histidine kinase [Chloroflexota bacterium]